MPIRRDFGAHIEGRVPPLALSGNQACRNFELEAMQSTDKRTGHIANKTHAEVLCREFFQPRASATQLMNGKVKSVDKTLERVLSVSAQVSPVSSSVHSQRNPADATISAFTLSAPTNKPLPQACGRQKPDHLAFSFIFEIFFPGSKRRRSPLKYDEGSNACPHEASKITPKITNTFIAFKDQLTVYEGKTPPAGVFPVLART